MTPSLPPADRVVLRVFGASLAALLALPAAFLHASDFTDFRIPRHSWTTANVDFWGSARRLKSTSGFETIRDGRVFGHLGGTLGWQLDSDALAIQMTGSVDVDGDRGHVERDGQSFGTHRRSEARGRGTSQYVALSAFARFHPSPAPWGIEVGVSGRDRFIQRWSEETLVETSTSPPRERRSEVADEIHVFDQHVAASLTVGVGRVRDATGVHQAWQVEQRLRTSGALVRPLSRRARQALAELHYLRGAYGVVFDRPDKRYWSDLVRLLREDGAIAGELDAFSLFRLLEPAFDQRPVFVRHTGFFAGPTVQASNDRDELRRHLTVWQRDVEGPLVLEQQDVFESSQRVSRDAVYAGVRAEAHLPLTMRTQLDLSSTAMLETQKPQDFWTSTALQLLHLVGERWSTEAHAFHARKIDAMDDPGHQSTWQVSYGVGVDYYLEDRWRIGIDLDEYQTHEATTLGIPTPRYRRDARLSLGVQYHLLGVLDTGGFLPTMWSGEAPAR